MSRLLSLFKRSDKSSKRKLQSSANTNKYAPPPTTNADIANAPVAGMQRSNQLSYITSYSSTQPGSSTLSQQQTVSSTMNSSLSTAVDHGYTSKHGESQWKGQPNGKQYDKREELSPEDEDMWAKMAM